MVINGLAAINVEKNARSANMELLHRKSSSQNFTGQQYLTIKGTCNYRMILLWIQASPKTQGATELTEKSYGNNTFLFSNETNKKESAQHSQKEMWSGFFLLCVIGMG